MSRYFDLSWCVHSHQVRKVYKEELAVQMDLAKKAHRLQDIEADALSAAGDFEQDQNPAAFDFKPSQVPGEAFVSAAKHNDQVCKTALKLFRDKVLMFPMPIRKFVWEDFIYNYSRGQSKKAKVRVEYRAYKYYASKVLHYTKVTIFSTSYCSFQTFDPISYERTMLYSLRS